MFFGWLTDDGTQIDAGTVEGQMRGGGLLMDDEFVGMAFRCGRDLFMLTNKRWGKTKESLFFQSWSGWDFFFSFFSFFFLFVTNNYLFFYFAIVVKHLPFVLKLYKN